MIPLLRITCRELRGGLRGFRVFLACLALGVAAIAGIGSVTTSVKSGLEQDGAALLGGDAALRMTHQDLAPDQRSWLEKSGRVSRVVYLRSMARVEAEDRRSLVEMKMVDDAYPLYGELETRPQFEPEQLFARRQGAWGAIADSALLERLGIGIGDHVRIGRALYRIQAEIDHEPDRVSGARALQLGPRFMASAESLDESGLIRPGSQVWYFYRIRLSDRDSLATWKQELEQTFPDARWVVQDHTNASPTIRRFLSRTALFMMLVGLTALLVGGVGIGNAVRDFLAGKVQTIATLKCVGASSSLIFGVYLAQILIMAVFGVVIGLVIGSLLPIFLAGVLRDALPIMVRVDLYSEPLLLAAAFGILTALAFSVVPVARACEIPAAALFRDSVSRRHKFPRWYYTAASALLFLALAALAIGTADYRVIASWFVAGAAAAMVLFLVAGVLAGKAAGVLAGRTRSAALRLALANLHRPGAPTSSVVLSLGLGLTVLVTVALIETNLAAQIVRELPQRAPSHFFIDLQTAQIPEFRKALLKVDQESEFKHTPMLRGRVTRINGKVARTEDIDPQGRWILRGDRGLTWAREQPPEENVVAGSWWPANYEGPPLVSLSAEAARQLGLGIGDTITVNVLGRNITAVISNLRSIAWGTMRMNFVFIYSPKPLEAAPQTHLATVHSDPGKANAIERALARTFPNVTAVSVRDVLATIADFLGRLGLAIRLTGAIAIVAGTLVLAGTVAAGHRRRVYDSVVLKVLGATRRRIMGIMVLEYGLLGLVTALVAAVIGSTAAWAVVTQVMRMQFGLDVGAVVTTTLLAVFITVLLGFHGTWRALGQRSAPLLRNE